VAALHSEGERVVGVRLDDGSERRADAVVVATPRANPRSATSPPA
jgi:glycine/D-amino acid oxidase-like deaminating enzyme